MHGPGATRQLGKMEAKQGRFSMTSPIWTDAGTYTIGTADTLVITGQLGPGTWTRVWSQPANRGSQQPPGSGTCVLLTEDEVAQVLRAPVSGGPDPKTRRASTSRSWGSSTGFTSPARIRRPRELAPQQGDTAPHVVDIPDVADGALCRVPNRSRRRAHAEGNLGVQGWVSLIPAASKEDQPYPSRARERGRPKARRASFSPPGPTDAQLKRLQAEEKAKAEIEGRISRQ